MSKLPTGFYEGDLYCFAVGMAQDAQFACIPAAPAIDTADGKPRATLLSSSAGALLSIQAVWQADEEALAAARAAIAARYPDVSEIGLAGADLAGVTATLSIAASGAARQRFGPKPASGTAANRAVFSETLTAAEKEAAILAFEGRAGILALDYAGTLELNESARADISGDLAAAVRALAPKPAEKSGGFLHWKKEAPPSAPPTLAACAAAVDDALAGGQLRLVRTESPNVTQAARTRAADELRATLSKMLLEKIEKMGPDAIYLGSFAVKLSNTVPETLSFALEGSADLGDWAAKHGGAGLVVDAGSPIPEPRR